MRLISRIFGINRAVRSLNAAKRKAGREVDRAMRRELTRGVTTIQRRYRSLSAPGPSGTAVKSGRLRASYTNAVRRQRGTVNFEGQIGLFGFGRLPEYFRKWEGDLPGVEGRPRRGALEAIRPGLTRRLFDACERAFLGAVQ